MAYVASWWAGLPIATDQYLEEGSGNACKCQLLPCFVVTSMPTLDKQVVLHKCADCLVTRNLQVQTASYIFDIAIAESVMTW